MERGKSHSYLGMQLEFLKGAVKVDMSFYIDIVLRAYSRLKKSTFLSKKDIFKVEKHALLLVEGDKSKFHMMVAQLLYLSKQTRPEVITTVSFLCMRVKAPTTQDQQKLLHLLE
jgi:hypothetical protein